MQEDGGDRPNRTVRHCRREVYKESPKSSVSFLVTVMHNRRTDKA